MTTDILLSVGDGATSDHINLNSGDYGVEVFDAPPPDSRTRTIVLEQEITGDDNDALWANVQALETKLRQAERAARTTDPGERVTLGVPLGTTDRVFFDVLRGTVTVPAQALEPPALDTHRLRGVRLELVCLPYARGEQYTAVEDVSVTNDGAEVLVSDVPGDVDALVTVTVADTSASGTINRIRLARRSGNDLALSDFDAVVDAPATGSATDETDSSAIGGDYAEETVTSGGHWTDVARATQPAGALHQGRFDLWARIYDAATAMSAPTGLSAAQAYTPAGIRQVAGTGSTSSNSASADWSQNTLAGSTLVMIASAYANEDRIDVTSSQADGDKARIDTDSAHGLSAGDTIVIADHSNGADSDVDLNDEWTVDSVISTTAFRINVDLDEDDSGGSIDGSGGDVYKLLATSMQRPSGWHPLGSDTLTIGDTSSSLLSGSTSRSRRNTEFSEDGRYKSIRVAAWYIQNASSRSGTETVTYDEDDSDLEKKIVLIEVDGTVDSSALDLVTFRAWEVIWDPESTSSPDVMLIGATAGDGGTEYTFGNQFEEQLTSGLAVGSRLVSEVDEYNYTANPDSFEHPMVSLLIGIRAETRPENYALPAGSYSFRVVAVNTAGTLSNATGNEDIILDGDDQAVDLSWTAPAGDVSHYRVYWQRDSEDWRYVTTADSGTSYRLTTESNAILVESVPAIIGASETPNRFRARIGTVNGRMIALAPVQSEQRDAWHWVHLATTEVPPEQALEDGSRPDWAVDVQAKNGGGPDSNVRVDALALLANTEPQATAHYPGLDLGTAYDWVYEVDPRGRATAYLRDQTTGDLVDHLGATGVYRLAPGDNIVPLLADGANGESDTGLTYDVTIAVTPRYALQKGA